MFNIKKETLEKWIRIEEQNFLSSEEHKEKMKKLFRVFNEYYHMFIKLYNEKYFKEENDKIDRYHSFVEENGKYYLKRVNIRLLDKKPYEWEEMIPIVLRSPLHDYDRMYLGLGGESEEKNDSIFELQNNCNNDGIKLTPREKNR